MYPEYLMDLVKKVPQTRAKRLALEKTGKPVFPPMNAEEREDVLSKFHPDYRRDARRKIRVGVNKGEKMTTEVADILEAHSMVKPGLMDLHLSEPDYETDLLIIGGGGAGCWAGF